MDSGAELGSGVAHWFLPCACPGNLGTVRMRLSPSDAVTPADALPSSFSLTVGRQTLCPIPGTSAPGGLRGP